MPRAPKQVDKTDPEYLEKRKRNNEAIKKSREKAKAKAEETQRSIQILRGEAFRKNGWNALNVGVMLTTIPIQFNNQALEVVYLKF